MSKTLIPSMALRWGWEDVPCPHFDGSVIRRERVLQQCFTTPSGQEVWKNVPTVEEGQGGE